MNVLVTGCAGFIGSHTCEALLTQGHTVYGIDSMCYAADPAKIDRLKKLDGFHFYECYINDDTSVRAIVETAKISHVLNFAAETHVDNSIASVDPFIYSNVQGVAKLIEVIRSTGAHLIHISTDEVYGVPAPGQIFDESSPLNPRNPYSATKAAADHLIMSAINTHGISAHIIRPSNNFGPGQHGEKFIPTILRSIKNGQKIPVYGDGQQRREWTFVKDTARSIVDFLSAIDSHESVVYNLSSENQISNLDVIRHICDILERDPTDFVSFVPDRAGHDREYRITNSILQRKTNFLDALRETVEAN
jgi:dTDP-glucose 4,6-dehydratase